VQKAIAETAVLGGRQVETQRSRARCSDGYKLSLPSWLLWSSSNPLDELAFEQMVLGASTQRYARLLEPLPDVNGHGNKPTIALFHLSSWAKRRACPELAEGINAKRRGLQWFCKALYCGYHVR
jgi:hypothetical protein